MTGAGVAEAALPSLASHAGKRLRQFLSQEERDMRGQLLSGFRPWITPIWPICFGRGAITWLPDRAADVRAAAVAADRAADRFATPRSPRLAGGIR